MTIHRLPILQVAPALANHPLADDPSALPLGDSVFAEAGRCAESDAGAGPQVLEPSTEVAQIAAAVSTAGANTHPAKDAGAAAAVGGLMRVGDLAKAACKTVRALHLYEELELLQPVARSKGGFRLYDDSALVRIRWISKLQDMGRSLGEIQGIARGLESAQTAPHAMAQLLGTYRASLRETRATVARLQALEAELVASVEYLETCGSACETTEVLTACTSCSMHDQSGAQNEATSLGTSATAASARAGRGPVDGRGRRHLAIQVPAVTTASNCSAPTLHGQGAGRTHLPDLIRGIHAIAPALLDAARPHSTARARTRAIANTRT